MTSQNGIIDLNQYKLISPIGNIDQVFKVQNISTGDYYVAEVLQTMFDEESQDKDELSSLYEEIDLISMINFPSILKFLGFSKLNFENDPCPTIITELAANGSLRDMIALEKSSKSPSQWNMTKKLINIYGIASGMSYLHSNNIIHQSLKPESIFLDDNLNPKISAFTFSKLTHILSKTMIVQSQKSGLLYLSPEILTNEEYSQSGDVYAFGFVVFELLGGEIQSENEIDAYKIMKKVAIDGYRPQIKDDIPAAYRNLIERCWSQKSENRPSFDQIIEELKTNENFITEAVNKADFQEYIKFTGDDDDEISDIEMDSDDDDDIIDLKSEMNGKENSFYNLSFTSFKYPVGEFNKLNEPCQILVDEAQRDSNKQFIVGKSLIEGKNDFPKNINLGFQYIKQSSTQKYVDSVIYYAHKLIKGRIIQQNFENAEILLDSISETHDKRIFSYRGEICQKKNKIPEAINIYEEGSNAGDERSMYRYAKMIFFGEGTKKSEKELTKYLTMSKEQGFKRSKYFLIAYKAMNKVRGYSDLPPEVQFVFISNIIKNLSKGHNNGDIKAIVFNEVIIKPQDTKNIFKIKESKLPSFYQCLEKFKNVTIEIRYPSKSFRMIVDNLSKIRFRSNENNKIGIVFSSSSSFPVTNNSECFSPDFSYHKIDNSNLHVPKEAFKGCTKLKQVIISATVKSIDNYAFVGCSSLVSVEIPSTVKSIEPYAFYGCNSLNAVEIPPSVTYIGLGCFGKCTSLSSINIPSSVTKINEHAFIGCSSLKKIEIPSSVTFIGDHIFNECTSLSTVEIYSTITSINEFSFRKCTSLATIILPSSVTCIESSAFYGCSSLETIEIPSSVISIKSCAFSACSSLTNIKIPSSITTIGFAAFDGCSSLKTIRIPQSVTSIGFAAFRGCSMLTGFKIPSSITSINESTFKGCLALEKIEIPSSVIEIKSDAFCDCSSLKKIIIPSSVQYIGDFAFYGCSSFEKIEIPTSVNSIQSFVFRGCSSLKNIIILADVTSIGSYAFYGCSVLSSIRIPPSVLSIGSSAFYGCKSLVSVEIPSSVTLIDKYVFYECSSLKSIKVPSSITSIGKYAFYGCSALKSINIPSMLESIGSYAFARCSSLESIETQHSVNTIGSFAFYKCHSLTSLSIPTFINEETLGIDPSVKVTKY